jgi:HK97 family phage major capsid protein
MPSGIGTAGAGAELTSEQVARILVNPLQARSVVLAAGPRVFDSQGDPLSIPKLAPMSTVGMTAENVAVPESDPVFSEVTLLPSMLKSFKRGYRISNELVRHSMLAIATVMGQAIVERTALEIDAAMLTGTGTSNTITGFTAMAGTSGVTLGASVSPPSTTCWMPRARCWPRMRRWTAPPGSCIPTCSPGSARSGRARAPAPTC